MHLLANTSQDQKNVAKTIFEQVIQQLNEFVIPNIGKKQKEQMNLSFYYNAVEVDLKAVFSKEKEIDEPERYIDNLFDCLQIQLKSFLNEFSSTILEIWEISEILFKENQKAILNRRELRIFSRRRIKKNSYKCKLYLQKGHNIKTCKKNKQSDANASQMNDETRCQCHETSSNDDTSSNYENSSDGELSTTSTSVREVSDTIESGASAVMVLILPPKQPINFQNCENTQRQCSVCHRKGHNA
ncbi:hypothetical protein C2G38_2293167 [Gigaspora rosea]|uniref:Uncharacterized protein n=1 Tax=Gigaspora rosea TaxID=44941 RepID=A0A397VV59_9GLOM|nr:hypothetical protein C2G38_2293167 [Gigaspora rosea]